MPITLYNHQRSVRFDLRWLRRFAKCALAEALQRRCATGSAMLPSLSDVEVSIVSDDVIASVHERFMAIPGPTDVITFAHGEIVISADTALVNAARYAHSVEEELALYTLHGLLHLNGFEDANERHASRMRAVQNLAFNVCLGKVPRPSP